MKLYTVKEFSEIVGVSTQAIYKRLGRVGDELREYMYYEDGKKLIDAAAVSLFSEPVKEDATSCTTEEKPEQPYVDLLRAEIETKNKQIEQLQQLLQNEQSLRLLSEKRVIELEQRYTALLAAPSASEPEAEAEAEPEPENTTLQPVVQPVAQPVATPKKWWQFWK